jgi:DNA mismatch repair protein MutS
MPVSPMMQQYREARQAAGDALLLFRMGDFYELFYDDAKTAARTLGLALTSRDKGDDPVPMAGFPHHQLDSYLAKIIAAGHRAAICEQVEDANQAKGLVKREVTRIVTPGTLTDDALLDPQRSNFLAAIVLPAAGARSGTRAMATAQSGHDSMPTQSSGHVTQNIGLAWVDVSTGRFSAATFLWQQVADQLARIHPAELLIADESPPLPADWTSGTSLTRRPAWAFGRIAAVESLTKHFGTQSLEGFGFNCDSDPADSLALSAAGAVLNYLVETQKASLAHINQLVPYSECDRLAIDPATRRSLELVATLRDGKREGSLLGVLDRTLTCLGARLMADWLAAPLTDVVAINARIEAVDELFASASLSNQLRDSLRQIYDIQRLLSRVITGRASPRDLVCIGRTLACLPAIKAKLTGRTSALLCQIEDRLDLCADIRGPLEQALVDDCPLNTRDGGFIRDGYRNDVDELRELRAGGKQWMVQYQAAECQRTGIANMKVGFNQVFGYYLEVTHTNREKVPANYIRKQTLKNAERYVTPELKEYEEKVLAAEEKLKQREFELFVELREMVAAATTRLQATADSLAELDVLAGLAELARSRNYVRPTIVEEPMLDIEAGRHPVLDVTEPEGTFVPNDVQCVARGEELGAKSDTNSLLDPRGSLLLITGPNMAGKSTYIRQAALLTLMAQIGSFVPARRATIGVADRIFARVGASDELSRGQSTFMVEMTETARILNTATPRSLVILDEIGRGTSTYDGLSLAWSIVEHIHNHIGCRTLFATHYHELTDLADQLDGVRNFNVAVKEWDNHVTFLHQIVAGAADKSYGIHVAQLAGVPRSVNDRAREVLEWLEAQHHASDGSACGLATTSKKARIQSTNGVAADRPSRWQLTLFGIEEHPLLEVIRATNLDELSARDALNLIHSWQQRLVEETSPIEQ